MNNLIVQTIQAIITSTLNGTISIDRFYEEWDETWNQNKFIEVVYYDLESAIEHMPGYFFSSKVNMSKWQGSVEYMVLKVELELLDLFDELSDLQLLKRRGDLISNI